MAIHRRVNKKTGEERWVAAPSFKGKKFPQRTYDTKAAASKYEREVREAAEEGREAAYFANIDASAAITMRHIYNAAMNNPRIWKSATKAQPENADRFCKWYGWKESPLKIDRQVIKDFLRMREEKAKGGLSPKTTNHYLSAINQLLKAGIYEEWYTERDVCNPNVLRELEDNTGRSRESLNEDEVQTLLTALKGMPTEWELYFRMMIFYGRRNAEITRMKRRDIFLDKGRIRFLNGKTRGKQNEIFLPMLNKVQPTLEKWLSERGELEPDDLLFDQFASTRGAGEKLSEFTTKILGHRWLPHEMRNTCLTRLGEAGMAPVTLQAWANHENIQTTMGYVKVRADAFKNVNELLDHFDDDDFEA